MKKIFFDYQLLLFLYAYLRSVDLSLDRSRWVPWKELQEYYKDRIRPGTVAKYLLSTFELSYKSPLIYFVDYPSKIKIAKYLFYRFFCRKFYLTALEVVHCCELLVVFENYLNSDVEMNKFEIEKLRIDITGITYYVIEFKLHRRDVDKAMAVEHFFQNENLDIIKIKDFIGNLDLRKGL